jgi:hypothetical protein
METTSFLQKGQLIITNFLGEYSTGALVIIGVGVVIGLGIWGTFKLIALGRKSAK